MNTTTHIQQQIDLIESQIAEVKKEIDNFDASDYVSETDYDDMLNDVYGEIEVCGYSYCASNLLSSVDPVAYHCGFNDYVNSVDLDTIEEYQELQDQLESLESELEDLENELEELEDTENDDD